jgi:hypothetical protein
VVAHRLIKFGMPLFPQTVAGALIGTADGMIAGPRARAPPSARGSVPNARLKC